MNFGKIAFGALLIAIGAVLLAIPTGIAHPDTPLLLLRYWPVLLIAFGLAFLASVIKNPFLGCFAVLLILGGTVFGIFWMKQEAQKKLPHRESRIDLDKIRPRSLSVRVHMLAGRFYIGAGDARSRALRVKVRTFAGDSTAGHRFAGGKDATLDWPARPGWMGLPPPGTGLDVRVPETIPLSLSWRGRLASMHADLTRLMPTRLAFHGIGSTILLGFNGATRPEEIRIRGFASNVRIRIRGDCPVRFVTESPLVFRSLPPDFVEWGKGRGKRPIYAGAGRGRPVTIYVDGPFLRVAIERMPLTTVLWGEDSEWQDPVDTASRSRLRSL